MTLHRTILVLAAIVLGAGAVSAQPRDVTVFAAASLKNALDEASAKWGNDTSKKTRISYAASSALARQIEAAAPADVFIPADLDWMNHVAGRKLIKDATRANLLGNQIVLIAGKDSKLDLKPGPNFGLRTALGNGRLAMANVDAVPAGKYGKASLEKLGVWPSVADRVAQAENVRAALLLVSRGEAPLGIVYRTDAAADPSVKILGAFPDDSHSPVTYPIAVLASSNNRDAEAFVAFLQSTAARTIWEKHGFTVLNEGR
jgi:molybdate transport system substrate-binding protein